MRIRAATLADAEPIADLHVRAWRAAYRGQVPDAHLDDLSVAQLLPNLRWSLEHGASAWRMWVGEEDDGALLGFASTGPSQDADAADGTAEVFAVYVDPDRTGEGVGGALLAHAVEDLAARAFRAATLWVLASNAAARGFYEAEGWSADGATATEYVGGEHLPIARYRLAFR